MLLSIGDVARASGLSPKALRLYDDTGLLVPAEVDPASGYRRYHPSQLGRARLVARLRLAGMPLARIRVVADADLAGAAAELTSYARQVDADARSARALLADLLAELTEHTAPDEEDHPMSTTTTPAARAATAGGQGGRATQQDAVHLGTHLYAVADGLGSAQGLSADLLAGLADDLGRHEAPGVDGLDAAVTRAAAAVAVTYADHPDAGCTLTALLLRGDRALVAHLGDSRLYRVRDGRVERLTRDHTVTQTLVDEGRLTAEEAATDERRVHLNRAVAVAARGDSPDLGSYDVRGGDRFVLTTDGVHGRLAPEVLASHMTTAADPERVAAAVAAAVEEIGADDNHVVVVVDVAAP
ncbi:MerR family transcriptional regulator [Nocardioides sp. CFH 31398]|uniref:MerR family transcriptional regulator n=1 Tax=Nocardioides sp. CFH 31398 TaxID=2919579 RepID=UPI001F053D02|nr:MerR family transcriptional regulator [Nocardioides sp. CFH 31398]MCH1865717.1 MerR family transcriptional regulator [Nocardioides sp. CFH 31398]